MRSLALSVAILACVSGSITAQDKPIWDAIIHEAAENEIAADKMYGGKTLKLLVHVKAIRKVGGSYIIVGSIPRIGQDVKEAPAGSEIKIAKGAEEGFATTKAGEDVVLYAQYKGRSAQPGAYHGYIVQFDGATLKKSADAPKDK